MKNNRLLLIVILGISVFVAIIINELWIQADYNKYNATTPTQFHPDNIVSSTSNGKQLIKIRELSSVDPQKARDAIHQFDITHSEDLTPIENAYRLLILLSIEWPNKNQETIDKYIKELHLIADKEQYDWLKATVYIDQAGIYARHNKTEQGKELIIKGIELAKKSNALYLLPRAYNTAGFVSNTSNKLIHAQDYFMQGIDIANQLSMIEENAKLHNNLAVVYMVIKDWNKALETIIIANKLYKESPIENKSIMHIFYSNKARIYGHLNNKEESKRAIDDADLYYNEKTASPRSRILHWKGHSTLMLLLGKYAEAKKLAEQCLSYPLIKSYPHEEGQCNLLQSKILLKQHEYNEALVNINKSIYLFSLIKHDRSLTRAYLQKGDVLISLKRDREALYAYKLHYQRDKEQFLNEMYDVVHSVATRKISQERDLLDIKNKLAEALLSKQKLHLNIAFVCTIIIIMILLLVVRQVIKIRKTNKELETLSYIDTLTGLYNRRYYYQQLTQCNAINAKNKYRIILFDIDNFKLVNDQYGHDIGDEVLVEMSNRISLSLLDKELLTRWGGEEFLALLEDNEQLISRVEAIRKTISEQPFLTKAGELPITSSIGVSFSALPSEIDGNDDYFRKADKNLYEAKRSGKNKAIFPSIEYSNRSRDLK